MKIVVLQKPEWLKIRPPTTERYAHLKSLLHELHLTTVCEEAHCPNISECWSGGTATFMLLGDTCTRACKFCAVKTAYPAKPINPQEPQNLAKAIAELNLKYVVITSVDRDDLPDQGAGHFAKCISELRQRAPELLIEVLIPDFRGNKALIQQVIDAQPHVIAHNIETVKSLQRKIRDPRANYEQSLAVLQHVKKQAPSIYTKSSIMLGLGEQDGEVLQAMKDLRSIDVDIITFGQYLRPSTWHIPVQEYVHPDKFALFKDQALAMGFLYAAAGPFVRSSYKAAELFMEGIIRATVPHPTNS